MPFPPAVREEALFRSRRSCSLCHQFAGLYTDVHHIVQEADGGPNTLENAIPLCDRCHGEVGHYNVRHPKGTKYTESELRRLRDAWWAYIASNPAAALPVGPVSVGPTRIDLPTSAIESLRYELHINNTSDVPLYDAGFVVILPPSAGDYELELGMIDPDPSKESKAGTTGCCSSEERNVRPAADFAGSS